MSTKHDLSHYKSLNYKVETRYDPGDECWYATLPELWETMADGETASKAMENVLALKDEVIELAVRKNRRIPTPRPEIEHSGRFLLRVPKSLHEKLAREAELEGTSINRLVIQVLSGEMGRRAAVTEWSTAIPQAITQAIKDQMAELIDDQMGGRTITHQIRADSLVAQPGGNVRFSRQETLQLQYERLPAPRGRGGSYGQRQSEEDIAGPSIGA